jgi:adenosylmethionine-8-amino-7-oxononanoate aminotransferase
VALAGITHEPAARLAAALSEAAPAGLEHVFFSDDGSTAVEVAIKMCVQYWAQNGRPRRQRLLALGGAFHGETLGATALGGVEIFRRPFRGLLMDCTHLDVSPGAEAEAVRVLGEILSAGEDEIAACVVEPMVQGAGGMRIYDAALLRQLRALTERHDVFLVADEVFTGYGRTGPMWACEHAPVSPDVLCVAKGFTGGILPMAATLCTSRLFEGFLGGDERALYYGHTYCGHALGAAVALEVLKVYDEERILEQAQPKAARLAEAVRGFTRIEGVSNPRALGMIAAVDVAFEGAGSGGTGANDATRHSDYLQRGGARVCAEARALGAYIRPLGNVVYLAPPLNIPDADLDALLGIVERALEFACRP